jgi:hypothetical protein
MCHRLICVVAAVITLGLIGAGPTGNDEDIAADEAFLTQHKVSTDGDALLAFFRKRTLSDDSRRRLDDLVKKLGDPTFQAREEAERDLLAFGSPALPLVKAALDDPDLEIARRARRCVDIFENGPGSTLPATVARVLARKHPAGSVEILVDFLPFADDESVDESVLAALVVLSPGTEKAPEALVKALGSKDAAQRAAAGHVLGRRDERTHREATLALLRDADARVRLRTALALTHAKERAAVPALIALLTEKAEPVRGGAEEVLYRLAGEAAPESPDTDNDEARKKYRDTWSAWWKKSGDSVDLALAISESASLRRTLGIEYNTNRVWECGPTGKVLWEVKAEGPMDAQVVQGRRVLIAESSAHRVSERDFQGKVLWECKFTGEPINCARLANGNTWVGLRNGCSECTRDGKIVYTHTFGGSLNACRRLKSGHVVYLSGTGLIGEIDAQGKQLRTVQLKQEGTWGDVDLLPNGRFLVTNYGANFTREVDDKGKVLWEQTTVAGACGADRLPNGHTLLACPSRSVEIDRAGKILWETKSPGYVRRSHRR